MQRGIGDVLLAWENEAFLASKRLPKQEFEIVIPSISILRGATGRRGGQGRNRRGTVAVAHAYLEYLYSKGSAGDRGPAPLPAARSGSRGASHGGISADVHMLTIADFGGWNSSQCHAFCSGCQNSTGSTHRASDARRRLWQAAGHMVAGRKLHTSSSRAHDCPPPKVHSPASGDSATSSAIRDTRSSWSGRRASRSPSHSLH